MHIKQESYSSYDRDCIVSDYVGFYREMFTEEINLDKERINQMTNEEFEVLLGELQKFNNRNKLNFYE